jgi:hypothetical protein
MVTLYRRGFVGGKCQLLRNAPASYFRPKHRGFQTLTPLSRQSIWHSFVPPQNVLLFLCHFVAAHLMIWLDPSVLSGQEFLTKRKGKDRYFRNEKCGWKFVYPTEPSLILLSGHLYCRAIPQQDDRQHCDIVERLCGRIKQNSIYVTKYNVRLCSTALLEIIALCHVTTSCLADGNQRPWGTCSDTLKKCY